MRKLAKLTATMILTLPLALGSSNAHAVQGGSTVQHAVPWIVSVQSPEGTHRCGATLIAPQWALTAGHCRWGVTAADLVLRIGSLEHQRGGQVVGVKEIVPHPSSVFDPDAHTFTGVDLTLLRLDRPIHAPTPDLQRTTPPIGNGLTMLGWGYICEASSCALPARLQQLTLPLADCEKIDGIPPRWPRLCTVDDGRGTDGNTGQGTSAGDSGGPAVVRTRHGVRLAGVVSGGGFDPDTHQTVSIFTDLSQHLDWINSVIHHEA